MVDIGKELILERNSRVNSFLNSGLLATLFVLSPWLDARSDDVASPATQIEIKSYQLLFLPIETLGERLWVFLDTGSGVNVFDEPFKHRLRPDGKTNVETASGQLQIPTYAGPEIQIGNVRIPANRPAILLDMAGYRAASGIRLEGVIGIPSMQNHVLQFDFDHEKVLWIESVPPNSGRHVLTTRSAGLLGVEMRCDESVVNRVIIDTGSD